MDENVVASVNLAAAAAVCVCHSVVFVSAFLVTVARCLSDFRS